MVDDLLEGFTRLIDSGSPAWFGLALAGIWLVYVLLVTVHELGHAIAGLLLTSGHVSVRVGQTPGLIHGRVGRLEFSWNMRGRPDEDDGGLALEVPVVEPHARLAFALAGPFANVAVALLLIPSYAALSGVPRTCAALIIVSSVAVAAWNLLARSPGSDGREAVAALRRWRKAAV